MKKLLLLAILLNLTLNFSSCTSSDPEDDTAVVENADASKIESDQNTDSASSSLETDQSLDAALADNSTAVSDPTLDVASTEQTSTDSNLQTDPALDSASTTTEQAPDLAVVDPSSTSTDALPPSEVDSGLNTPTTDSSTAVNEPPMMGDSTTTSASEPAFQASQFDEPTQPKTKKSKKSKISTSDDSNVGSMSESSIATTKPVVSDETKFSEITPYPFETGFVNTVYVVRKKEKLADISQLLFGTDKTKELKKINPKLKARSPKAGDKVFYVSPNRPTDSSRMISYYEDNGMIHETYLAKKGDTLKKVAKELLGYDSAWKEVWASNSLNSKSTLQEGETFRYWRSASVVANPPTNNGAQVVSNMNEIPGSNNMAQQTPPPDMPPPPTELPPPPSEMAPPPNGDMTAQGSLNTLPPPEMANNQPPPEMAPPPEVEATPPPPPPPPRKAAQEGEEEVASEGMPQDDLFTFAGIAMILIAGVAFVMIKRKKKMAAEMAAMNETEMTI